MHGATCSNARSSTTRHACGVARGHTWWSHMVVTPGGHTWWELTKAPTFQSGMSSAANFDSYHFMRSGTCSRSCQLRAEGRTGMDDVHVHTCHGRARSPGAISGACCELHPGTTTASVVARWLCQGSMHPCTVLPLGLTSSFICTGPARTITPRRRCLPGTTHDFLRTPA